MDKANKVAWITCVTGQDGAYLAQLLLEQGYGFNGIKRRWSSFNTGRIENIYQDPHEEHPRFVLHYGDMTGSTNLIRIVQQCQPDEIYNLAAQSHVQVSICCWIKFDARVQRELDRLSEMNCGGFLVHGSNIESVDETKTKST